jgi:signal recognition particle subunit SRP54
MDLGAGIRKAIAKITGKVVDESAVRSLVKDLQRTLIMSDVNVALVSELSKKIEQRALREKPLPGASMNEHVIRVVYEELVKLMGEGRKIDLKKQKIMVLGLFGSGKTTNIGKVARYLKQRGVSVGVIAADMMRPAAYEQLEQLSKQAGCDFYGEKGKKAHEVVANGLKKLKNDVIIVDTSGRSALDGELIDELKRVNDVLQPDEKILVMSADIGQIAKKQTEEFHSAVGITGVILTKMDGSGKGGGALSASAASGTKIMFIGVGEKLEDLEEFKADKFVGRLLGVPDFEALAEKIKAAAPEMAEAKELPERFDVKTFYDQLKAAKKLGPLKGIFQSIGMVDVPKDVLEESEKKFEEYEAIIASMTKSEREDPEIVRKTQSRVDRIANGAGVKPEAVRMFLSQFTKMKKMYEQLQSNKGLQKQLERFMKKGGGSLGAGMG